MVSRQKMVSDKKWCHKKNGVSSFNCLDRRNKKWCQFTKNGDEENGVSSFNYLDCRSWL